MAQTFHEWFASSQPGDNYTYHTGLLVKDRRDEKTGKWDREVVDVRLAYNTGYIDLVARRARAGYEYIAIRRKRRARIDPHGKFVSEHLAYSI